MIPKRLERRLVSIRTSLSLARLLLTLRQSRGVDSLELGGADARDAALLVLAEPGLLGVAEQAAGQEVGDEPEDDADKGNGVEEVDRVAKDADANDDAPKVGGEEGNVEERGGAHAQDERCEGVEEGQAEGVADEPAGDLGRPVGLLEGLAVEDGGLDAVDNHAKEADEGEDVVHGRLGDEPLLEDVAGAVEGGAEQGKEVALERVGGLAVVGVGHVVGREKDAHAAAADEDSNDLEDLVADLEEEEGDEDDADNGPKVDELRRQDVGVAVGLDGEVVALDVERGHDDVLPAILPDGAGVEARPVTDEEDERVDEEQQDVVEDGLEGGDVGFGLGEEAGKGVGRGDAQRQHLADGDNDPKVGRGQVAPPVG